MCVFHVCLQCLCTCMLVKVYVWCLFFAIVTKKLSEQTYLTMTAKPTTIYNFWKRHRHPFTDTHFGHSHFLRCHDSASFSHAFMAVLSHSSFHSALPIALPNLASVTFLLSSPVLSSTQNPQIHPMGWQLLLGFMTKKVICWNIMPLSHNHSWRATSLRIHEEECYVLDDHSLIAQSLLKSQHALITLLVIHEEEGLRLEHLTSSLEEQPTIFLGFMSKEARFLNSSQALTTWEIVGDGRTHGRQCSKLEHHTLTLEDPPFPEYFTHGGGWYGSWSHQLLRENITQILLQSHHFLTTSAIVDDARIHEAECYRLEHHTITLEETSCPDYFRPSWGWQN